MSPRGRLLVYRAAFGVLLLAMWELVSGRLIDPFWISSPSRVFAYLWQVVRDGSIFGHLAVTLYETTTGFLIGAVTGIGCVFLVGRRKILAQGLDLEIGACDGIPRIALARLFM